MQPVPIFSTCPHVQCCIPPYRPKCAVNQSVHAIFFRRDELPVWNRRLHHVCECHKRILGEFLELFCDEWTSDQCEPMPSRLLQLQRIFNVPVTTSSSIRHERKFAVCWQPYWIVVWRLPPQLHSVHRRQNLHQQRGLRTKLGLGVDAVSIWLRCIQPLHCRELWETQLRQIFMRAVLPSNVVFCLKP